MLTFSEIKLLNNACKYVDLANDISQRFLPSNFIAKLEFKKSFVFLLLYFDYNKD